MLALWSALCRAVPTLCVNDAEELSAGPGGNSTSSFGAQVLDKHINGVTICAGSGAKPPVVLLSLDVVYKLQERCRALFSDQVQSFPSATSNDT